jgi:AcrR family transcriptional regulator
MASNNGRDNILAAAHKTFLQFGYRLTSMTQIAEEAGIPRQALYLLFPSKQELFNAVVARIHNAELAEIRAALSSATTPAEKLLAALDVWYVRNYTPGRESSGATKLYESSKGVRGPLGNGHRTTSARQNPRDLHGSRVSSAHCDRKHRLQSHCFGHQGPAG